MLFNFWKKKAGHTFTGVKFRATRDGCVTVDRKSLHESPGFKRQLEALRVIAAHLEKVRSSKP